MPQSRQLDPAAAMAVINPFEDMPKPPSRSPQNPSDYARVTCTRHINSLFRRTVNAQHIPIDLRNLKIKLARFEAVGIKFTQN